MRLFRARVTLGPDMSAKTRRDNKEVSHVAARRPLKASHEVLLTLGEAHVARVRFPSFASALSAFGEALRAIGAEISAADPDTQTGRSVSSSPPMLASATRPRAASHARAALFPGAAGLRIWEQGAEQ